MSDASTQFDAIVIGSGITGGWAAKELTERGLKVLVLERGRELRHGVDYLGEHAPDWKLPYNGKKPREFYAEQYPIQSKSYAFGEDTRHFFVNDKENPYQQAPGKPFEWVRGNVVGGRSLLWGRQTYRWSEQDFEANRVDGNGMPWPIGYKELAPWYSHVEDFIGVTGQAEGLPQLPDGEFLPPMDMFALEKTIKGRLASKAPELTMTMGRAAILTRDHKGRAACHYCGPCQRGCSTGSYFSSQSSTLPAAEATGNLTLVANAVVERLVYDEASGKLSAVEVIDSQTREKLRYSAKLFFLCASTLGTTQVLLNSPSGTFPNGLANRSGSVGRYLMDHLNVLSTTGIFFDDMDSYYYGNRPNNTYIPRFRNLPGEDEDTDFVRGYGYQALPLRGDWKMNFNAKGFGAGLKDRLRKPGPWLWALAGFGECLPQYTNRAYLHPTRVDRFGIPQLVMDFEWGPNELALWRDMDKQSARIMKAAGAVFTSAIAAEDVVGGSAIHEMGTARMGDDPNQAVLNAHNQAHDVPNLFVTDGACMTSSSCVNPSLTYMALTARACAYAVTQLAEGQI
ncbi:MAG: GMC family oxidoreductase [Halieaceae bacterium]